MNPQTDNSAAEFKEFMSTLTKVVICPYCGEPNQLDPALLCCGEVHAEEVYDNGEETFTADCLEREFKDWLAAKEAYVSTGGKYEK